MAQSNEIRVEPPKIVLIDDDPSVRRSIQFLLLARGYNVRSYVSCVALLADPLARDAVCLIADYRMPEFDGIELLRAFRALGWRGSALLITAYHSAEVAKRAVAEGFDAVMEKPLSTHLFTQTLSRLLHAKPV